MNIFVHKAFSALRVTSDSLEQASWEEGANLSKAPGTFCKELSRRVFPSPFCLLLLKKKNSPKNQALCMPKTPLGISQTFSSLRVAVFLGKAGTVLVSTSRKPGRKFPPLPSSHSKSTCCVAGATLEGGLGFPCYREKG